MALLPHKLHEQLSSCSLLIPFCQAVPYGFSLLESPCLDLWGSFKPATVPLSLQENIHRGAAYPSPASEVSSTQKLLGTHVRFFQKLTRAQSV